LFLENAGEIYLPSLSGGSATNSCAAGKGPGGKPNELTDRNGSKYFETQTTKVVIQPRLQMFTFRAHSGSGETRQLNLV
jgi:hypothetical protein